MSFGNIMTNIMNRVIILVHDKQIIYTNYVFLETFRGLIL